MWLKLWLLVPRVPMSVLTHVLAQSCFVGLAEVKVRSMAAVSGIDRSDGRDGCDVDCCLYLERSLDGVSRLWVYGGVIGPGCWVYALSESLDSGPLLRACLVSDIGCETGLCAGVQCVEQCVF